MMRWQNKIENLLNYKLVSSSLKKTGKAFIQQWKKMVNEDDGNIIIALRNVYTVI